MFSKDNNNQKSLNKATAPAAPVKPAPPSLISRDFKVVGNLKSDGEIQIDGSVEGDIRCKTLLIGESAHIKGEVIVESVVVHGTVNGQIESRSVKLASSAHVVGDILHADLSIETGAYLEGHCRRFEDQAPNVSAPPKMPALATSEKKQSIETTSEKKQSGETTSEKKLGSTFPPEQITTVVFPLHSIKPLSAAANPITPPGSTTKFNRTNACTMAERTSASLTVIPPDKSLSLIANVKRPGLGGIKESQMVVS